MRALLAGGALLSLAVLTGLSLAVPAHAAFPGLNGRIACSAALHMPTGFPTPLPAGQSRLELFDILPNGTGERRLTDNTRVDVFPKFSPDGTKIAFQVADTQIWTMNADGTNQVQLTTQGTNSPGSWSPDGTQIVFTSNRTGNNEIFRMNADGSNQVNLTNNPPPPGGPASRGADTFAAWSPDGSKILFRSDRDGNPNLYTMNVDGTAQVQLTNHPEEESGPAWSPDGSQIAFHTDRDEVPPRPGLNRNLEIYRMNANGSGTPTRLTFNDSTGGGGTTIGGTPGADLTGYDLFPAWSPDGSRIVFHSGRAPEFRDTGQAGIVAQWEAYTIDAGRGDGPGGNIVRLTNRAGNDERCDWQALARPAQAPRYPVPYPQPPGGGTPAFAGCPSSSTNLILGTIGNDNLTGTPVGDRVFSGAGNDRVSSVGGRDCVSLGSGADRGSGGAGGDLVLGGSGGDRIGGGSGGDRLRGNSGNDRLAGNSGNDNVTGASGRDRVSGGSGRDRLSGNSGRDAINGDAGRDRVSGSGGGDRLRGGSGRDRISGGSGNDRINSRDGAADRVNCGSGRDRVVADRSDIVAANCESVSVASASAAAAAGSLGLPALIGGAYVALLGWRRRR